MLRVIRRNSLDTVIMNDTGRDLLIHEALNKTIVLEERITELEKQFEALRMSLKNYAEQKETLKLWGRKRR